MNASRPGSVAGDALTEDTLMPRSIHLAITAEVCTLLERALFDLEHDWPAAGIDTLRRARRLFPEPVTRGEMS